MLPKQFVRSAALVLLPVLIACGTAEPRTATQTTSVPTAAATAASTPVPARVTATAALSSATAQPTPTPEIGSEAWYRQVVLSPTLRLEGEHPDALSVALDGQMAYVLRSLAPAPYPAPEAGAQLCALDLSRPDTPQERGCVAASGASGLTYAAPLLWLATAEGIQALDVSDPRSITTRTTFATTNAATLVRINGGRAFITTTAPSKSSQGELLIVDISDLDNLRLLGRYEAASPEVTGVEVAGDRAYLINSFTGMDVLDIGDPAAPRLLGSYQTDQARGIALEGELVYLATGRGLEIVDVADPAAPRLLGSSPTPFSAIDVQLEGERLYLSYANIGSSDSGGMEVLDVGDPRRPALLAQALLPAANTGAVQVSDGLIALPSSRHGLLLLREVPAN
ncbi:MAG TPA: hypothetical protein VFS21_22280 [Roseiflexaceae bacterium]|nr:hypothetical protein [Roseiflexaceae bacterium]